MTRSRVGVTPVLLHPARFGKTTGTMDIHRDLNRVQHLTGRVCRPCSSLRSHGVVNLTATGGRRVELVGKVEDMKLRGLDFHRRLGDLDLHPNRIALSNI